jgi:signal peptidase II
MASISGKLPHYISFNNLLIPLKKLFSDYAVLFLIAGIVILLDQVSKAVLRQNLMFGEIYHPELWISQYIRVIHLRNTAATNGMFQNMSGVLTVFPFVVAIVILYYFPRVSRRDWLIRLGLGLYLGGALGNLIDRLRQGYVTDFISIGYFPVFNLADACVSLGVVCLFVGLWQHEKAKKGSLNSRDETITPA